MLFFLILSIAQAINADNKYTTHIFDSVVKNNYTKYPELYAVQNIQESVQKLITLRDGRKITCQIPIPQLTKPFNISKLKINRNLTEEESNYYLFPLEDQCTSHKTKEFIYEYCFKKYIRQYDDLNTMSNMQKTLKEDFSLGHSQSYIKGTNLSTGIHQPNNSRYFIDTNYHQIIQQVDQLIIIDECFAKLRNFEPILGKNIGYQISVSTETQNYNFTVQVVIHSKLLLLQQCSDSLIISDFFEITTIPTQQERFLVNQYYTYKNIIFGLELRAQEMFQQQQTIGVIYSEKVHMVQIEKIIDFCAVQVIGFKYRKKAKQSFFQIRNLVLMDQNAVYEEMKGPVFILENILFFEWVDTMDINDYVITFENTTDVFSYIESYRIAGYKDGVAILDKQFTNGLRYFGKAFIRRNGQYNYPQNYSNFINNNNSNEIDFYSIEHQDIQMYLFNQSLQNFKINVEYQTYSGITFYLNSLKQAKISQLFIKVKSDMYKEVEISFLTIPENNIFVKTYNGKYTSIEPRFFNSSILAAQYWIIIDASDDKLYIGRGFDIDITNRLIQFQLDRLNNKQSTILFEFDKKSIGMKVSDLMIIPLKNFKIMESDLIQGTFTPLNYTGQGLGQYIEEYQSGSYCKPINSTRQSQVILQCYPGDLLRFISIVEEEICEYKITIGTRLLCDTDYDIVEPSEQHIMCILKQ